MSKEYIALKEGCGTLGRIFTKPIYTTIVIYMAKTRWFSHRWHSRTLEEIQKEICKDPDFKPEDINLNILEMLVEDGWIKTVQKADNSLPEYEITKRGRRLAVFLKDSEIAVLFKPKAF